MCNCKNIKVAYNNATQTIASTGTQISVLGNKATCQGCGCSILMNGFRISKCGTYRFSYDVTLTATSAGVATLQLYQDGMALPCASASATVTADDIVTMHMETTLQIGNCCSNFYAEAGGVEGAVNHVCASVIEVD